MEALNFLLGGLLVGLWLGGWLVGYKFASNARQIQRVEWKGRIYKVYDVTNLDWHLAPEDYQEASQMYQEQALSLWHKGGE